MKEFDREETGRVEFNDFVEISKYSIINSSDKKIQRKRPCRRNNEGFQII